jgi:pyruvate,water dikinase
LRKSSYKIALKGIPASPGIGEGPPAIIENVIDAGVIKIKGKNTHAFVLVLPYATPFIVPLMLDASAIVTEVGGVVSHAAIIARELSIPCVVSVKGCLKEFKNMSYLVVNGYTGVVYGYDEVPR